MRMADTESAFFDDMMLKVEHVSKRYKLGEIGGTTLRDELQRLNAKMKGKEDPTRRIGEKDYNKGETFMALDDVSFEVRKGERVGIIGHNGAGKSTLLKLISRVTAPTGGRIGLNGRVASMLEVGTGFHGELTGRENIYMNGAILGMTKKEIEAKIEEIIEFSECRQFIDTPVKRYSSGMYVKLAFAVAAHLDSEIMIMDEVLALGDMKFQKKCLGKMGETSTTEGKTILYVSHNMATIRELCNRCIVLDHGHLIYDGDVEAAIKLYSGEAGSRTTDIDTRNMTRIEWLDQRARINRILLLDSDGGSYAVGEKIKLRIEWECFKQCRSLYFRAFVLNGQCQTVATVVGSENFRAEAGKSYIHELTIDLDCLMPDSYWLTVALTDSQVESRCDYEWIERAVSFDIRSDFRVKFLKRWSTKVFGNVMLPDMICHDVSMKPGKQNDY